MIDENIIILYAVKGRIDATYGKSERHAAAASLITILCRLRSVCTYGSMPIDKYFLLTAFRFFSSTSLIFRPKLARKIETNVRRCSILVRARNAL